ncbi:MAG: aryl-sulfate sulfotransferase [Deltaproteobacteria bacterium]|nr:aryl-sulfate sulfotransferase [Deltaproteobacteria bacterium]
MALGSSCLSLPSARDTGGNRGSGGSGGGAGTATGGSSGGGGGSVASGGSTSQGGSGGSAGSGGSGGSSTTRSGAGGGPGSGGSATGGSQNSGGTTAAGGRGGTTAAGGSGGARGGASGQGGQRDAGQGGLGLTGLKIDANSKNVLSCFVSWKTEQAASSVVQFGVGKYEWEIADADPVTDHKVVVIGMHASQTYQIKAISTAGGASASAEGSFKTGALPATIPVAKVTVIDTAKMQPGWTLMNIQKGDGTSTAKSQYPAMAVIYDADGQPVWYYIDGTSVDRGGAISVDLTDRGILLGSVMDANAKNAEPPREVDFAGNTLWQCSTPTCGGTGTLTHHVGKLSNGHYIIQRDVGDMMSGTSPVYEEITADGKVVWSLDYRKFVPPPSGAMGDWCHGNSITVDIDKNEVYANCRFMGLIKTTYQNPTLVWHLPASYSGKGITNGMKFSPATSQYSDTHDPEIHDDGTILFFDNGGYSGVVGEEGNPHGYHSRAVEYEIDEAGNTATLVWEFPGSFNVDPWYKNEFYLPFWGDADRLANGNVLVTAGVRGANAESRIFEVTKQDGKVVWEFRLPVDFGVYRSERLSPPPLVRSLTQ